MRTAALLSMSNTGKKLKIVHDIMTIVKNEDETRQSNPPKEQQLAVCNISSYRLAKRDKVSILLRLLIKLRL